MTERCSRDIVLDYLSTFEVKPQDQILIKHIVGWCLTNQQDLNRAEKTYIDRVAIMTKGTGKWNAQRSLHGYDDVLMPAGTDYVRLLIPGDD